MALLAVYGTLKKGFGNHSLLAGSKLVFEGYTEIPYQMYRSYAIPYLVPAEGEHDIFVEVYKVSGDTLREIDSLEAGYQRERVEIEEIGEKAFIYVRERDRNGKVVEDGNW